MLLNFELRKLQSIRMLENFTEEIERKIHEGKVNSRTEFNSRNTIFQKFILAKTVVRRV